MGRDRACRPCANTRAYLAQFRWFGGNHSDIGGSYPEPESRLSMSHSTACASRR
ncbi:DUF2235 domain-containing protein [Bradyrhizobium sp. 137]|nr:DUF2235 domain-containing protein [Bradyrhizobium sp. 137]MCK1759085.1 DUF2235 domain-containing protein [Bradyrhizobium sp. 137]